MKLLYKFKLIVLFTFLAIYSSSFAQLTINITSVPESTSANENIFLAGNINSWNPGDSTYILAKKDDKSRQITFNPPIGHIEYKFTRGNWRTVEGNGEGQDIENRIIDYSGKPTTVNVIIDGWKENKVVSSTAAENVSILHENFYIPQLNLERKIWVYLPPDYESTDKSYPVLYMHDGQNIFDASTSFSGEWEVDETLNDLFSKGDEGVIVVGIENGGESRIEEYTAWEHPKYGGGKGDAYIDFIVESLKPYVDTQYRTLSDRENTGIMGSSLGGLISFYAAINHQDVFSKAGIFSPSFWFSDEVYELVDKMGKERNMKIYLLGGELESESLVNEINAMVTTLKHAGFEDSEIKMVIHKDGKHNEGYWKREFSDCYRWLFK